MHGPMNVKGKYPFTCIMAFTVPICTAITIKLLSLVLWRFAIPNIKQVGQ